MRLVVGIALVWFIIEILLWVLIAQFVSGWYVFFWFIVAAVIGISLMKKSFSIINPMAQAMKSGVIPNMAAQPSEAALAKTVASGIAGILLVMPGLLSDVVAVILLIPSVQKLLSAKARTYAMNNQAKMMDLMAKQMGGTGGFGNLGGMGGSPFGNSSFGNNPFGNTPFGNGGFGKSPFGGTTVDGEAKDIKSNIKKITQANDD